MQAGYDACEGSVFGLDHAINYAPPYIYITQFRVVYRETLVNMACSFAAVGLISLPVLQSGWAVAVLLACVLVIDVELLGLIWCWGMNLNAVTMISLVMAVGLVVDYLAHILHCFTAHGSREPDPRRRMAAALDEVGGAVLLGATTTFVGVLPLAFASSFIYRSFFKLFLSISILGIANGFVVAPCAIVFLTPPSADRSVLAGGAAQVPPSSAARPACPEEEEEEERSSITENPVIALGAEDGSTGHHVAI